MSRAWNRPALGLGLLVAVAACGDSSPVADIAVRVEVTPARDTVIVGEISTRLSAVAFNAQNDPITNAPFTWRSDQPFIAAVDSLTGAVTGVQAGIAAVTARTGSVSDTAAIVVISALRLRLPLDTIALAPGDTFTVPVDVQSASGPVPPVVFRGGVAGVATIDSTTGLVTALGDGIMPFTATADTVTAGGEIVVLTLADTTNGVITAVFEGAVNHRGGWGARAFNHPTDFGSMFQISARTPTQTEFLGLFMTDSLTAPAVRAINELPPSGIQPPANPVCRPATSFAWYTNDVTARTALSLSGGTVSVTSLTAITGGRQATGQFDVTMQITDIAGAAGQIRARGTFVVPLIELSACP